jgi:hypothetical protein
MIRPFLALLLCASPMLAQGGRVATLGDRVKVYAPLAGYKRITGEVVATTPDVLSLKVKGADTEVPVGRAQIDRLLLSVGRHRNIPRGAAIGAILGLGGYLWFGPRELDATALPGTKASNRISKTNLITGTVGGAALGALIGNFAMSDVWVQITPAAARNP